MTFSAPKRLSVASLSWVLIGSLMAAGPASLLSRSQTGETAPAAAAKAAPQAKPVVRKALSEEQEREGYDRPDLRRDANLLWFGGAPSPAELDARNALAAREVERWAYQIPGAPMGPHALPLPANSISWVNLGPFTQNSNGGYGTDGVDVDSGRPMAVLTHPTNAQIIYLATSGGGIFKCTNADLTAGATAWTWNSISDGLPATSSSGNVSAGALGMGIGDATHNTIYAGMGDSFDAEGRGFFRSTNAGGSWTAATGIGNQTRSHSILVLPQAAYPSATGDVIYWGTNDGLKRSIDGGATFTNAATVGGGGDAWSIAAFGSSTQNLVCSLEGGAGTGIYYSSNAGQTWTLATITGPVPAARISLATTPASATIGYGIYEDSGQNVATGTLKTADSGHTWTWQAGTNLFTVSGDGGQGWYNHLVTIDPANANTVFVAANLALYRSTDGGVNWTQLTHWYGMNRPYAHADFHGAFWSQTGTSTMFIVGDGGMEILRDPFRVSVPTASLDTSFMDTRRNYGLSTHLIYNIGSTISTTHADDKYRIIAGLQDNGTRVRIGSGPGLNTSTIFDEPATLGGDGFGCHINAANGDLMMGTSYYAKVYKSTDGGVSFSNTYNGNDNNVFYTKVVPGMADATGNTMYTFKGNQVVKTTDYGTTAWSALAASPGSGIRNINTAKTDPLVLGVTRNGGAVDITSDGGTTWTHYTSGNFPNNVSNTFNYIWFDTTSATTVYVASAGPGITGNHLWKKVGAGAWTAIDGGGFPTGIPIHVIQNDPMNANTLLLGSDFGVYRSTDGGATWSRYGQGMPLMAVRDLYIAPDGSFVRAASFGRGVWELVAGATLNVAITAPAAAVTLVKSGTQSYSANVTNFSSNDTVNWSVGAGGGSFSPTSTTNASPSTTFTAGTTANTFLIKATAAEDGTNNTFVTQNVTVVDPTSVNVVVSPSAPTVVAGATQSFSATVTPITNTAVTWGSSPAVGSINASTGLYTAPSTPPATAQSVTITATSTAAPSRTGTATVTVPAAAVSVSPTTANVPTGTQQQFTATVTGATNTAVTWSVFSGGGSVSGSGLYTAPGATGSAVVRATSVADPTKFADAAVTIVPLPIVVTIAPASISVNTSGTQQFTATVANYLSSSAVTWSVVEGSGGSVSGTGMYTAPASTGTFHVKATSVEDNTKSATATVTVQIPVTITITPTVAYLQPGGTATFTGNPSTGGTNYSVVGGAANGTITTGGVYTAPATEGDYQVKAQAQADNSKVALADVHVHPIVVTVTPPTANVQINTTQQFGASVTGNPNTAVLWSIQEGAAGGSVDSTGLYTAPAAPGTYHVRAASAVDNTKVGAATVTVTSAPAISVTVAPATVSLSPLGSQTFTATVLNGATSVTWSVEEAGGGSITPGGAYTAPAAQGVYHVRATSTADTSKFGRATVTVASPVTSFTVAPATATILTGQTVVLTGAVNIGTINWVGSTLGSLSASSGTSVTFTAPSTLAPAVSAIVPITASASADTSQTRTITINVKTKDQNADSAVDALDLAFFARYYGTSNVAADLNGDGIVDDADITIFLTGF